MEVGDSASITRSFSRENVIAYVDIGGAPVSKSELPEPLIGALFSYLLGVELPGRGTNYLKQQTEYLQTAQIGERLTATVEITRIRADKQLVDLATTCVNDVGDVLARGRALVLVRDVARPLNAPG